MSVGFVVLAGTAIGGYYLLRQKALPGLGIANGPAGDLDLLAGRWECTFRDPAGRVYMHKIKEINGNSETATWYRADGTVFRVNRVEFQLDTRGDKKVFRYFNGWASDGVGLGQPFPSGEYVYTLEGDTWTEFDRAGGTIVWTRMRECAVSTVPEPVPWVSPRAVDFKFGYRLGKRPRGRCRLRRCPRRSV